MVNLQNAEGRKQKAARKYITSHYMSGSMYHSITLQHVSLFFIMVSAYCLLPTAFCYPRVHA